MNRLWVVLACLTLLVSCRGSKEVTGDAGKVKKMAPEELLSLVQGNLIQYEWFSGKAKMKYDDGNKSQGFTANIRMRRDSVAWVSITSLMGIEVARIHVDSDTIQILDKLNKKYINEPVGGFQDYVPFELNLRLVQELVVGNFLWDTEGKLKSKVDNGLHVLLIENKSFEHTFWIRPEDYTILKLVVKEKGSGRQVDADLRNYNDKEGRKFSEEREIDFTDKGFNLHIEMDFNRVKWDEPTSFPFKVSDKYDE